MKSFNRVLGVFVLLIVLFFAFGAYAVGTLTFTRSTSNAPYRQLEFNWTSTAGGAVSGILSTNINGKIVAVITDPGSPAPTDNYDVTMIDANGFDVLMGRGIDRDTVNTERVCPGQPITDGTTLGITNVIVHGTLELRIANAGSATQGKVILLVE
jgi:hypothetical protein